MRIKDSHKTVMKSWLAVAVQVIKEFWLPFLLTSIWTSYKIRTIDNLTASLADVLTIFGPSFFLCSWAIGQIFRVRKQVATETSFRSIEAQLTTLVEQTDRRTTEMIYNVTGGDSYPIVQAQLGTIDGAITWIVLANGKYPIFNLSASICDLRKFEYFRKLDPPDFTKAYDNLSIDIIHPNSALVYPTPTIVDVHTTYSFNIFMHARNGQFTQQIRMRFIDGNWCSAIKITKRTDTLTEEVQVYQNVDDAFPNQFTEDLWAGRGFD